MNTYDVGVLIGRFQVANLTEGHHQVIKNAQELCDKLIIMLGLSPCVTKRNPLDFQTRRAMIQQKYPDVEVRYIRDFANDRTWSKYLDQQITDLVSPNQQVVLLGSRDSFISSYHGRYDTHEIESRVYVSESEQRAQLSKLVKESSDFRSGQVYQAFSKYDSVFPTVDIFVKTRDGEVLLVKKEDENEYKFPGGFVATEDSSLEEAASRELKEETGLSVNPKKLGYLFSHRVDDWRYRNEAEKIHTIVFIVTIDSISKVEGSDDVAKARWVPIDSIGDLVKLVPEHQELFDKFKNTSRIKFV